MICSVCFSSSGVSVVHRGKRRHGEVPGPAAQHVHHPGAAGGGVRPRQHPAGSAGVEVSCSPRCSFLFYIFQNVTAVNSKWLTDVCILDTDVVLR